MSTPAGSVPTTPSTTAARAYRKWQQMFYPQEMWWAVACVIALAILVRLSTFVNAHFTKRSAQLSVAKTGDAEKSLTASESPSTAGNVGRVHRRFLPATLSFIQFVFFRLRLPLYQLHHMNVAEMAFSACYLSALLIWAFINSHDLTVGYWANRAAHLATSQTPLIVALAGKNNIVSLLTGIGYEKLNILHRAAARSTLILIWVHAFGRWRLGLSGHFSMEDADIRFGAVAMVAFTLATMLSIRPIRNMAYELFLICHIVLVAMYLIFGLFHVPEVKFRFWPALAVWALDRALRALRLIVLNRLWINIFPIGKPSAEATIERVSSDTVRMTVPRNFKWMSGQHAFIIAPSIAKLPFEAHPFTIASSCGSGTSAPASDDKNLVFIVRARDGFTKRLLKASEHRRSIPVYVDGPYGAPPSLLHYSTCVFFAGGSGVSYTLPLLVDLVRQVQAGNAVAQRVLFVWVIRDHDHIDWISNILHEALQECPSALQLDIRIHVTQQVVPVLDVGNTSSDAVTPIEDKPSAFEDKPKISFTRFRSMKILHGRPDINTLVDEELVCAVGRVSVDVSGPAALANGVREALITCEAARPSGVFHGAPRTTLHVETFGW